MGPRSRDRGIANISQANNVAVRASMGPRSRDRGIVTTIGYIAFKNMASMGPRSRDRGIFNISANAALPFQLQWGRGHVTAESHAPLPPVRQARKIFIAIGCLSRMSKAAIRFAW